MEFIETYKSDGTFVAIFKSDALPKDYSGRRFGAKISVEDNGSAMLMTRANGNGSIRYRYFQSYAQAQDAVIKWAKRKIAEQQKAAA
jgi:hypothetical protein